MEDKKSDINTPHIEVAEKPNTPAKKKNNFKWILLIVFAALLVRPFLKPERMVNWLDYESGVKLAKEQNKPIFIAFYKEGARICVRMWSSTFNNKGTIEFIEKNYVPIMVDVDKQPDIAKKYDVGYYPTFFVKTPDNSTIIKSKHGDGGFSSLLRYGIEYMKEESEN